VRGNMEFKKYQHVERIGKDEVDGIEVGECWIFPKIDGTNGSIYLDTEGNIKAGSRNRELTPENDNAGFYNWVLGNKNIKDYLQKHPTHRLFGEFLVPHTLRTYRDNTWRRFYIFDVCTDKEGGGLEYIPYSIYQPLLEEFNLDYIPPIARIKNPTYENFINCLEQNNFLIQDGKGVGEGIVIKNYNFYNKYKRQVWAKIVANEFKEKHSKGMGCPEVNAQRMVEEKIVDEFCTVAFVEKEFAKIVNEKCGWKSEYILMLFGRVFHELVKEEIWNIVKKYKNPKIDFKTLNAMVIRKIKEVKCDLFA
jgi:hypothetical protein